MADPVMAARGRIGGLRRSATHSPEELIGAARAGFDEKWLKEVDPDGTLNPEERARRAKAALAAHMARLALKSAEARRRRSRRP